MNYAADVPLIHRSTEDLTFTDDDYQSILKELKADAVEPEEFSGTDDDNNTDFMQGTQLAEDIFRHRNNAAPKLDIYTPSKSCLQSPDSPRVVQKSLSWNSKLCEYRYIEPKRNVHSKQVDWYSVTFAAVMISLAYFTYMLLSYVRARVH